MANRPAIYMDSCCFIDAVKQAVGILPTERDADTWFIKKLLEASRAQDIKVYTSYIAVGECLSVEKGQKAVSQDVQERFRNLLTSGQYVALVAPSPKTAAIVQRLRWEHGLVLGSPDAFHIASAMEVGCSEFISTDERLKKPKLAEAAAKLSGLGLRLIKASDTANLPDDYRQGTLGAS